MNLDADVTSFTKKKKSSKWITYNLKLLYGNVGEKLEDFRHGIYLDTTAKAWFVKEIIH